MGQASEALGRGGRRRAALQRAVGEHGSEERGRRERERRREKKKRRKGKIKRKGKGKRKREREREIKITNLLMMDHEGINQGKIRLGMDFGWKRNRARDQFCKKFEK